MESKSFTNKDVNKKFKKKLPSLFIGEYYDGYNDIHMFNKNITNVKALNDIQSDLNRSLNLFIQDLDSSTDSINVVNSLREKIGATQLSPSHLCQELTNTYGLSLGQANYIAMSSTQGSIGGGFILNSIISKVKPDINFMLHRHVPLSKIIIDNSKNVQYIGGQVILFDVSQANNSELLNKGLGVENYLLQTSHDKVILYITVDLGKLGQDLVQELYVQTDIAVQGSTGNKILAKLKKITTKCDNVNPEEITINYIEFSDTTLYNKGEREERYECLAKENEVWYEIDLNTEDAPSSRQLSINQSFKDNSVNPYLKNISTFCLDTNSIPNILLAEDDNVSTNSLVDKFKLLSIFNKQKSSSIKNHKFKETTKSTFYVNTNLPSVINNDQEEKISPINDIEALLSIVKQIVSDTTTSDAIIKLKEIFDTNNIIKKKLDEFISILDQTLNDDQLHKLNTSIMQTMHILLPIEDKDCYLRSDSDKILCRLLFLEAKRHNISISLPKDINDKLSIPHIPKAILDHYATLRDTFYNQENRQSEDSLAQRIAKSIHWLFINPLLIYKDQKQSMEADLLKNLLKFPGEYTRLLIEDNILSKIIHTENKDRILLNPEKVTESTNNIMQIFLPSLINLIIEEIQKATTHNISSEVIQSHFTIMTIESILDQKQLLIDTTLSFLETINSPDKAMILSKLLSLHTLYILEHNFTNDCENKENVTQEPSSSTKNTDTSIQLETKSNLNPLDLMKNHTVTEVNNLIHNKIHSSNIDILSKIEYLQQQEFQTKQYQSVMYITSFIGEHNQNQDINTVTCTGATVPYEVLL